MTLLWVTEHFVMRRLSATMIFNVSMRKLRSQAIANKAEKSCQITK